MSCIIRKAELKDAYGLSELFYEFIDKESDLHAMQEQIAVISKNPQYYVAVACKDDKVIGSAMGIVCYDLVGLCGSFMLVENVVVDPEYRGQGIGKLLMSSIEDFGVENKCKYVILVSEAKREQSHGFYESIGYTSDQQGFKKQIVHKP